MSLDRTDDLDLGETPDDLVLARLPKSDLGNARRLMLRRGQDLRWVPRIGWRVWTGTHWAGDDRGEALARQAAHDTADGIADECSALEDEKPRESEEDKMRADRIKSHWAWAAKTGDSTRTRAMLEQAGSYLARDNDQFNPDPMVLNVANGTLHFSKAEDGVFADLRPHNRSDYCTETAPVSYDPDALCPAWESHLEKCLPEADKREYLRRWVGYSLTGLTTEQCFLICQGGGADGKSTTINALASMLGGYAMSVSIKSFLQNDSRSGADASPDIARLAGPARFVYVSEPKKGDRLDEAGVKSMTGGDKMVARKLRQDIFEFFPVFKMIVPCNPLPRITSSDHGTWRRVRLLEWRRRIEERDRDPQIDNKLAAEKAGILNWAIQGLGDWLHDGLATPVIVKDAVDRYRGESDPLGDWISERLDTGPAMGATMQKDLHEDYCVWADKNGVRELSAQQFGYAMTSRGLETDRRSGMTYRKGVEFQTGVTRWTKESWEQEKADLAETRSRERDRIRSDAPEDPRPEPPPIEPDFNDDGDS